MRKFQDALDGVTPSTEQAGGAASGAPKGEPGQQGSGASAETSVEAGLTNIDSPLPLQKVVPLYRRSLFGR